MSVNEKLHNYGKSNNLTALTAGKKCRPSGSNVIFMEGREWGAFRDGTESSSRLPAQRQTLQAHVSWASVCYPRLRVTLRDDIRRGKHVEHVSEAMRRKAANLRYQLRSRLGLVTCVCTPCTRKAIKDRRRIEGTGQAEEGVHTSATH